MSFEFFFYDWISIDGSYNFFIDLLINLVLSSENQQRKIMKKLFQNWPVEVYILLNPFSFKAETIYWPPILSF